MKRFSESVNIAVTAHTARICSLTSEKNASQEVVMGGKASVSHAGIHISGSKPMQQ